MKNKVWFKQHTRQDNLVAVTKNLLHYIQVPVTHTTIRNTLYEHPFYPSLSAFSDVLTEWKIENMGVELDATQLTELEYPVVAQFDKNDGHYVMLYQLGNNSILYIDPEIGWVEETIENFSQKWSGVLLMIDKNEHSGEKDYKEKLKTERLTLLRLPVIIFLSLCVVGSSMITKSIHESLFFSNWITLLLTKIAGSILYQHEFLIAY